MDPNALPDPLKDGLGALEGTFNKVKAGVDPFLSLIEDERARRMVISLEEQEAAGGGDPPPLDWFLQQNIGDLKLVGTDPEFVKTLEDIHYAASVMARHDAAIQAEVDSRVEAKQRGNVFAALVGDRGADLLPESWFHQDIDREAIETTVRQERGLTTIVNEMADNRALGRKIIEGGLSGAGTAIGWAFQRAGDGLALGDEWLQENTRADETGSIPSYNSLIASKEEEIRDVRLAQAEEALAGVYTPETRQAVTEQVAQAQWDNLAVEDPETHRTYMDAAGGDEFLAAGIFLLELQESPEAQDQISDYLPLLEQDATQAIDDLEDFDFTPGDQLLDWMATYSRNVPMRFGSTVFMLMTDADVQDTGWSEKWSEAMGKAAEHDFSVAESLGIDGTLQGLLLEIGVGVAFDPATYLFGPRGAIRTVRPAAAAAARALAKNPMTRRVIRDITASARAVDQGPQQLMMHLADFDDITISRSLAIAGHTSEQLPGRLWRLGPNGKKASYTETATLSRLIPDDVRALVSQEELIALSDDIIETGSFKQAVEMTLSRGDRTMSLTDGVKRVLVAEMNGWDNIPAFMRVVDDVPLGKTVIPGFADDAAAVVRKVADDGLDVTPGLKADLELVDTLITNISESGVQAIKQSGTKVGQHTVEGRKFTIYRKSTTAGSAHQAKYYMIADDTSELVSSMWYNANGKTISTATKPGNIKKGHQSKLWDAAGEIEDVHPIEWAGRSETTSQTASDFAQSYANRLIDDLAPPATLRPGTVIDDMMETGETLLKDLEDLGQITDPVVLKPSQLLPDRLVRGVLDEEGLAEVVRAGVAERGMVMEGATHGVQARGWGAMIRNGLNGDGWERWVQRQFGAYGTNPNYQLHGINAATDMMKEMWRLYGSESHRLNDIFEDIIDAMVSDGKRELALAQRWGDELDPMLSRVREIDSLVGGKTSGIDDALRGVKARDPDKFGGPEGFKGFADDAPDPTPPSAFDEFDDLAREQLGDLPGQPNNAPLPDDLEALGRSTADDAAAGADDLRRSQDQADELLSPEEQGLVPDTPFADEALSTRFELIKEQENLMMKAKKLMRQLDNERGELTNLPEVLQKSMITAYEMFNREFIATQPGWKHLVDPTTGMVPWEELAKGLRSTYRDKTALANTVVEGPRKFLTRDQKAALGATAFGTADEFARKVLGVGDVAATWRAPVTAMDLVAATTMSGRKWAQYTKNAVIGKARESAFELQKIWIMDKVGRPSTGMVVSTDELLRIFQQYGAEAVGKWMQDRGIMWEARLRSGTNPFATRSKIVGAQKLNASKQARLQALTNRARQNIQLERQVVNDVGIGWDDVLPSDPGYLEAAQRWSGNLLQDEAWRAMLGGKDRFLDFWHSSKGEKLRSATVAEEVNGEVVSRLATADEVFDGMNTYMDIIGQGAKANGNLARFRADWVQTAAEIDAIGGVGMRNLPVRVFDDLGPVRGTRKPRMGEQNPLAYAGDRYMESIFESSMNYRRGFLAELVRETEVARLESLYASQGLRIMSDIEVEMLMGIRGAGGALSGAGRRALQAQALDRGIVMRSMVDDLVERAVQQETNNVLYNFNQGSRAGAGVGRFAAPFGKPWADMAAYWGREVLRKPVVRGVWKRTLPRTSAAIEKVSPFNLKAGAFISRMADTDFSIDQELFGQDIQADFSPFFFLPTGGQDPFGTVIPGLGFIPMQLLDQAIHFNLDSIDDAAEIQNRIDSIAQFIPAVGYNQGKNLFQEAVGGGLSDSIVSGLTNAATFLRGDTGWDNYGFLQDPREQHRINQQVIDQIAGDPEFFTAILEAATHGEARNDVAALVDWSTSKQALGQLGKGLLRAILPVNVSFDTGQLQSDEVWLQAANQFADVLDPDGKISRVDLDDADAARTFANRMRSNFFDLSQAEQDAMIVQYPHLAINTVGTYEWTDKAFDEQHNIEGTGQGYRTGGDLDRHQALKDNHFIEPIPPEQLIWRIIGRVERANVRTNQGLYVAGAQAYNDYLWENGISNSTLENLQDVVDNKDFVETFGYATARDLWENWGTLEKELEYFFGREEGVETIRGVSRKKADLTPWDHLRDNIKIPSAEKAWSTTWPGLDDDQVPDDYDKVTFGEDDFTPEMRTLAEAAGIDLVPEMSGEELFREIQNNITTYTQPAYLEGQAAYNHWVEGRNDLSDAIRQGVGRVVENERLDPDWRRELDEFMIREQNLSSFYFEQGKDIPRSVQDQILEDFVYLQVRDSDNVLDWDQVFTTLFEGKYGPIDWTPPDPKEPDISGFWSSVSDTVSNTVVPYDVSVVDGDTLTFQFGADDRTAHRVRLLGVNARDYGEDDDGAETDETRLRETILQAVKNGDTLFLVRDPKTFGETDNYGRMLAWLWVGDTPFYFPDEMIRSITPSGTVD